MGFVRFLMSGFNPTCDWEEEPYRPLVLDLDGFRLCGVGLQDPVDELRFLGRAQVNSPTFTWPHKGVSAAAGDGHIGEMGIFFGHPDEPSMSAFEGDIRFGGSVRRLSREVRESELLALFGRPYWRDRDEDEILLFYEFRRGELQVEFGRDGGLKYLGICEPVLADDEQRKAYGVTEPWPPEYPS